MGSTAYDYVYLRHADGSILQTQGYPAELLGGLQGSCQVR